MLYMTHINGLARAFLISLQGGPEKNTVIIMDFFVNFHFFIHDIWYNMLYMTCLNGLARAFLISLQGGPEKNTLIIMDFFVFNSNFSGPCPVFLFKIKLLIFDFFLCNLLFCAHTDNINKHIPSGWCVASLHMGRFRIRGKLIVLTIAREEFVEYVEKEVKWLYETFPQQLMTYELTDVSKREH